MPPSGPENFLNDPKIQVFGNWLAQEVLQKLKPVIGELRPGGRPVIVSRRDRDHNPIKQETTTPQLLAELNDNLIDLVDELALSNSIALREQQLDEAAFGPPKRTRRRKKVY